MTYPCDGSGTVVSEAMRRDGSWYPLPCPVCDQEVPTAASTPGSTTRVYLVHLPPRESM